MGRVKVEKLPGSSDLVVRPFFDEEPSDAPYREVANVRLRRAGFVTECEAVNEEDQWFHWYAWDDAGHAFGLVSLAGQMSLCRALGWKAHDSAAAWLIDRCAPRVAALERYRVTQVNGVTTMLEHVALKHEPHEPTWNPPGLDAVGQLNLGTVIIALLGDPLGPVVDETWVQRSAAALEIADRITSEAVTLGDAFFALPSSDQQQLLSDPEWDWGRTATKAGRALRDVVSVLNAVAKVVKTAAPG